MSSMSSSSADDYEFVTPTVEHYSKLYADINEQVKTDASSSSLQSLSCSTKSGITDANPSSKIESSTSLSPNTSKNDGNSDTSDTSEDLDDLVAEANKMIAAAPKPSPSSQKRMVESKSASKRKVSSRTTSKRKATSMTADHTIISPRTRAAVAAAGSAPTPKRGRQRRSQSLTATTSTSISAPVFETVTHNKRRRSTLKDKKPVLEVVTLTETSSDEDEEVVEGMDIDVDLDLNQNEFVDNLCTVRIRWKDEILRFTVPEETKMSKIRMEISERIPIRADNLLILGLDTREVSDYVIVKNLPIGILEVFERPPIPVTNNNRAKQVDLGIIQVKIQGCKGYRERLLVFIKKTTHVKQLVEDFVEKYGYHGKHFKLVFDGDTVDLSETPESLGLDGGEMFDIVEVK